MHRFYFLPLAFLLSATAVTAQPTWSRVDTVPVTNGQQLIYPWAGGLNFCQFSEIDLNGDGIQDMFVFDRTGNRITTFINQGTPNQVSYVHAPQYQSMFPPLHDWVLLRDYDCDGKADIFTYENSGMRVYHNTTTVPGNLQFTMRYSQMESNTSPQHPTFSVMYISAIDIPAIRDVDGDGDLDLVTASILGTFFECHLNRQVEQGQACQDTIPFELGTSCWGEFFESPTTPAITINQSCRMMNPELIQEYNAHNPPSSTNLHAGSCMELLDVDGDGDKELLLGDIAYGGNALIHNGGTPTFAHADTVDANYPGYNVTLDLNFFPCAFQVDVDNDNKKDLLFSPNTTAYADNIRSVRWYKNIGRTDSTVVDSTQDNLFQDNMIEVGEGAYPQLFDYDGDGDKDLLIGDYGYYTPLAYQSKIALYKNIGTATTPAFSLITDDFAHLYSSNSGIMSTAMTFGDLDGDGDKDMIVGDENGQLFYFEKQPGNADNFVLTQSNYQGIDVGNFAFPQLIDVDRDGKLDLVIGRQNGFVSYYRNTGTTSSPTFTLITGAFGGIDVREPLFSTGYSTPFMYDDNGSYKMLVGSEKGWIWQFDNIDGNLSGQFNLVDSTFMNVREGARTYINGADLNNDSLMDLVIGNYAGGLGLYMADANVSTGPEFSAAQPSFDLYPNPASGSFTVNVPQFSVQSDIRFALFNALGQQVMAQNVSMQRTTVDASHLAKGVYICQVTINGKPAHRKLVINN